MKRDQVRVGIIGSGFGGRVILPCFSFVPEIRVVALTGRDTDKVKDLARKYDVPYIFNSFDEMLHMSELDLVCIATPPYLHSQMAERALSHGKHVLCEKPMALNRHEARRLLEMASSSHCIALIDHQLRFHPNIKKIRRFIASGELGNVHHAEILYQTSTWVDPAIPWSWWSEAELGGGELNAIGSHFFDILRYFFGDAISIQCHLKTSINERRTANGNDKRQVTSDDYVSCRLLFEGGVDVSMINSSVSYGEPCFQMWIFAERGTLIMNGFDNLLFLHDGNERDVSERDGLSSTPIVGINPWRRSLVRYAEHISRCILKEEPVLGATFDDGYRIQVLLDAARQSSYENRMVVLSELNAN